MKGAITPRPITRLVPGLARRVADSVNLIRRMDVTDRGCVRYCSHCAARYELPWPDLAQTTGGLLRRTTRCLVCNSVDTSNYQMPAWEWFERLKTGLDEMNTVHFSDDELAFVIAETP